jgi:hypothetical protein
MESYSLKFDAVTGKRNLPASGNLFVYESATVPANEETRIKVKPDNGGVIVLKPGQWFRNPDNVTGWALESFNGDDVIDAVFVIGFGEFGDANTLNKFTLDASLTNAVTVTNTVGNRVPVSIDTSQTLNTSAPIMAYTNAVAVSPASGAAGLLVSAAANTNGVIIEQICTDVVNNCNLLAKTNAPAYPSDGDFLALNIAATYTTRQRVAAGKAVYIWNKGAGVANVFALFTLL